MYDLRPSRPSRPAWLSFAIGMLVILVLVAIVLTIISYLSPFAPEVPARPPRILATLTPVHIAIVTVIMPTLTPIPTNTPVDTPTPTPTLTPTLTPTPTLTLTIEELRKSSIQVPYKELVRYTEKYINHSVLDGGEVVQVMENAGVYAIVINVISYGDGTDTVLVICECPVRPLKGDEVNFTGIVKGRISYQTVLGDTATVPEIIASSFTIFQ